MEGENKRYIDPMVDAAFKRIFGSEINKDLLIAFLNEIFQGRRYIIDLVYNKNEYPGEIAGQYMTLPVQTRMVHSF